MRLGCQATAPQSRGLTLVYQVLQLRVVAAYDVTRLRHDVCTPVVAGWRRHEKRQGACSDRSSPAQGRSAAPAAASRAACMSLLVAEVIYLVHFG